MRVSDALVEKLLLDTRSATAEQLKAVRADNQQGAQKPLQDLAIQANLISEKDLTKLYAAEIDVPFVELKPQEIKHDVLHKIPERIARQYNAVVFDISAKKVAQVAMSDPDDIQAISFLKKQLGDTVSVSVATRTNILACLDQYRGNSIGSELTKVISGDAEEAAEEEINEDDIAEDSPIAQTVNLLIEYAIRAGASDVHIEPREEHISIRYRVDGVLREANKLPKKVHGSLVSRIKILSNLKIDERRAPQDGRFKIEVSGQTYALRVSTLPITDGEKVVMRVLNESAKALSLEELGYWGHSLNSINEAMKQPHGMILVTGPTGSGKSTSLFSVLSIINKPSINISTVEDPVEYRIPGANQVQLNPKAGMTFASGLRALMRQDPNVIMVGEIRDGETADIGVQAALTGHLVFATLHTNNAATCLPRLLDMGVEPFLIASTVRAVVGQRLVRKLCIDCREEFKPDPAALKEIDDLFGTGSAEVMRHIHELEKAALEGGIGTGTTGKSKVDTAKLSTTESKITILYKPHDGGCASCGNSGYRGRFGIYEVLSGSSGIQQQIIAGGTSEQIQETAIKQGMVTMQLDGFIKALRGQTSVEEILRVTSEN